MTLFGKILQNENESKIIDTMILALDTFRKCHFIFDENKENKINNDKVSEHKFDYVVKNSYIIDTESKHFILPDKVSIKSQIFLNSIYKFMILIGFPMKTIDLFTAKYAYALIIQETPDENQKTTEGIKTIFQFKEFTRRINNELFNEVEKLVKDYHKKIELIENYSTKLEEIEKKINLLELNKTKMIVKEKKYLTYFKYYISSLQFTKKTLLQKNQLMHSGTDSIEYYTFGYITNNILHWTEKLNQLSWVLYSISPQLGIKITAYSIVEYIKKSNKVLINGNWNTVKSRIEEFFHKDSAFIPKDFTNQACEILTTLLKK